MVVFACLYRNRLWLLLTVTGKFMLPIMANNNEAAAMRTSYWVPDRSRRWGCPFWRLAWRVLDCDCYFLWQTYEHPTTKERRNI